MLDQAQPVSQPQDIPQQRESRDSQGKKSGKKLGKKWQWVLLLCASIAIIGGVVWWNLPHYRLKESMYILVVGVDTIDAPEVQAMAVMSIQPNRELELKWFPSQSYVQKGEGPSYLVSGSQDVVMSDLKDKIGEILEVEIPYYLILDYQGFAGLVDEIGGITMHLDRDIIYRSQAGDILHHIPAGNQHLSGEQALLVLRYQPTDESSWLRISRQQGFFREMIAALANQKHLVKLPKLLPVLWEMATTNLSLHEGVPLALWAMEQPNLTLAIASGRPTSLGWQLGNNDQ